MEEVREIVEERIEAGASALRYSWVQVNEFRLFELHDRCLPWGDAEELRAVVGEVP